MTASSEKNSTVSLLVAVSVILGVFLLGYFNSLSTLFAIWIGQDDTVYRNGLLVLACTIYLMYDKRAKFQAAKIRPNGWASLFILLFGIVWAIGNTADIQSLHIAALPLILMAVLLRFLGFEYLKLAFLPISLLYFAIPIWWPLLPILQTAATNVTQYSLEVIGIPVFVSGYYLYLPGGSFVVAEGCAGLSFLLVSMIVSVNCIELFSLKFTRAAILVLAGVSLALIANWTRVLVIVLIGHYTNMQNPMVENHYNLGWVIFGFLTLTPLFVLNHYLAKHQNYDLQSPAGTIQGTTIPSRFRRSLIMTSCVLLIAPLLSAFSGINLRESAPPEFPASIDQWMSHRTSSLPYSNQWQPIYRNASVQTKASYSKQEDVVDLHLVYYASQTQDSELINSQNSLVDDSLWSITNETSQVITTSQDSPGELKVNSVEVVSVNGSRRLVWYWYDIGGYYSTNPVYAKVLQVWTTLTGRSDASLIAISTICDSACSESASVLETFMADTQISNLN